MALVGFRYRDQRIRRVGGSEWTIESLKNAVTLSFNAAVEMADQLSVDGGEPPPRFTCRHCGQYQLSGLVTDGEFGRLRDALECSTCHHFIGALARHGADLVVADGNAYVVGGSMSPVKGFHGQRFLVDRGGGHETYTDNLWHLGMVPEALRGLLPDNAVIRSAPIIKEKVNEHAN